MSNYNIIEMKPFIPAKDFQSSIHFYLAIGFELEWSSDDLASLSYGECRFLLQDFYEEDHAKNFMMHMLVEHVDDWFNRLKASGVVEAFHVQLSEPEDRSWGMRDFTLHDPSGVLWRVAQSIGEQK